MSNINDVLRNGKIIDNKMTRKHNMKEVLEYFAKESEGFKTAVGYFYLEGLIEIINSLKDLKEIKILMGYETTKPTKEILLKTFKNKFEKIPYNIKTSEAMKLFYRLVKEYNVLKVRVYFGNKDKFERLHSKAYLFLNKIGTKDIHKRYNAAIIGSSNLTPSGLVGNTELNTIILDKEDLEIIENWFDKLWDLGNEDFEKLKISEMILRAMEESKFKKDIQDMFLYLEPKEFFKILIKFLNADYLFEEYKKSKLLQFQYVDFIRVLNNFNGKNYRGCFLTSSVGLGKSYVASQVAKYYISKGKKVLLIAPSGLLKNEEQWHRYLKEFNIYKRVDELKMGKLQIRNNFNFKKYAKNYDLIIIDEAHNFRNPDSYRTKNLKRIIDNNGKAKILLLTATPINTSLEDLLHLIELFQRRDDSNLLFKNIVIKLKNMINILDRKEIEELTEKERNNLFELQETIEREMFVKSTRETIKTSKIYIEELKEFTGINITKISDPEVQEIEYDLDPKYKNIIQSIVNFISELKGAHLKIIDPERGGRLGGFFKILLYKRFESDITSYYLTLERLYTRNKQILKALEKRDISYLEEKENLEDIDINFQYDFKNKLETVISNLKKGNIDLNLNRNIEELKDDTKLIKKQIDTLKKYLVSDSKYLFQDDKKIESLKEIITKYKNKKLLIFTEYKDTLKAVRENFKKESFFENTRFIDSNTKHKDVIIKTFNNINSDINILITTDTLSEGFNISGADIVVNFDIPYNPVRIIQRIGRATRLDNPKKIKVLNFKPHKDIDLVLNIIEKLEMRIKNIIRFVGIEYRIWFEIEEELLKERRKKDKKLYLEVLKRIFEKTRAGKFDKFEINLDYSKPILLFLQKAIKKYKITNQDLENITIPKGKYYTLFKGKKGLSMIYNEGKIFNENILSNKELIEIMNKVNFEKEFKLELKEFYNYKHKEKNEEKIREYFNDNLTKKINSILNYIDINKLQELYNNEIVELEKALDKVSLRCGANTERIVKKIYSEIRKDDLDKHKLRKMTEDLKNTFTQNIPLQKKLTAKKESLFAIGFSE